MKNLRSNRRKFLKKASLGLLGTGLIGQKGLSISNNDSEEELPKIKEYRTLGRTEFKVSDIGMGMPKNPAIIKAALNAGVNYLDSAANYGKSERDIGQVINEYDRKSIFLTTKIQSSQLGSKESVLNRARKSLEALNVDNVDCYVLQGASSREIVSHTGFHEAMDQLKAEGRVKYCGIACHNAYSLHDPGESMQNILLHAIEDGRFDLLLVIYNYLNSDQGATIMKAAKEKNIATMVMKSNPVTTYHQFKGLADRYVANNKEIPFEKYLKTLDARKTERMIFPPLEQVSSLHLDYKAKEMGYQSGIQLFMQV